MNINPKTIMSYIDFLNKNGFSVSIHDWLINDSIFHEYNHHNRNAYCYFITNVCYKQKECNMKHFKILEKAADGSFFGSCYAGVCEFVYPIKCNTQVIGYISVGAFRDETSRSKALHFAEKHDVPIDKLEKIAATHLSSDIPDKKYVDSALEPLVYMIEQYYDNLHENSENQLLKEIKKYLVSHRHEKITMDDLSEEFNYSVSTLSHLFIKHMGMTLPEYINNSRLKEAKWYLENSNTSIADISKYLGYSSCNYFSAVFKKSFGITPKKYRDSFK